MRLVSPKPLDALLEIPRPSPCEAALPHCRDCCADRQSTTPPCVGIGRLCASNLPDQYAFMFCCAAIARFSAAKSRRALIQHVQFFSVFTGAYFLYNCLLPVLPHRLHSSQAAGFHLFFVALRHQVRYHSRVCPLVNRLLDRLRNIVWVILIKLIVHLPFFCNCSAPAAHSPPDHCLFIITIF